MTPREQRGKVIADTCTIERMGKLWRVPSQSGKGTYTVNLERVYCSCPDFIEHGHDCKHIFAVRFQVTRTEKNPDGSETVTTVTVEQIKKPTYPQDWPNYNRSQVNELRHFQAFLADICGTLPEPAPKRGQKPIPASDAAFCAVFKTYSTMSARRFMGDLDAARDNGFVTHIPHFNSILNFFDREDSTAVLHDFVTKSAAPLTSVEPAFTTDSTGYAGMRYLRWFDEKYGRPRQEVEWLKLHATIGVKTNVVTACKVTGRDGADTHQFKELTEKTAEQFTIKEMSADKAYTSKENCETMEQIGGQFYPAFKKNATGKVGGAYQKVFHLMCLNQEDYAKHYHKRSNIESTFSAMKRKFGESLRSKSLRAMENEILAKVVCHNITCVIHAMYELNIDPEFVLKPCCTTNPEPAQRLY
jgi:transposase